MKLRLLRLFAFALMLGVLGMTACTAASGKPTVVISSPPSGSQYKEGDDVAIQSTSGDATGVVRIELDIDGAVVRNDTPPSPQTNFPLIQTWKATAGSHTVTVRAYNAGGVASDAAAVSIQVSPSVALNNPSPTATSSSAAPSATPTNKPAAAPVPPGAPSSTPTPTKGVLPPPPGCTGTPVITSFTVSAPSVAEAILINVASGATVTLHWGAVSNADSVEIDHGIGGVPAPGTATDKPGATTTYTMTAHCGGNSTTTHVTVNVTAPVLPPAITATVRHMARAVRVEAGATDQVTIDCAAGTRVTGGGFAANSSLVVYSNDLEGNGWEMAAKNIGGAYTFLEAEVICASNISGTTSQVVGQVLVPANATEQAVIDCPAGTVLTGGGFAASADQEVYSNAIHGSNGWQVGSKNNAGTAQLLNSYAICYTGSGASSSFVVNQVSISPGISMNSIADCPSETLATGGGYAALPGLRVNNTLPSTNGWGSNASNTTGSAQLFNSYAICTHF